MKLNIVKFYRIVTHNRITACACELSYYLMFAFFPIIMVVYAAFSIAGKANPEIFSQLTRVLPQSIDEIIYTFIEHIGPKSSNISFLITGIALTIFSVTKFAHSTKHKVRKIYGTKHKPTFLQEWLTSGIFSILLIAVFFVTLLFMILGEHLIALLETYLYFSALAYKLITFFRYGITFFVVLFVIYLFYYTIPNVRQKFGDIIYGTVFTVFGWIVASVGFTFYMNNFERYSVVYGSIGAIIILLLWFYTLSLLLLAGSVINSIRYNNRITKHQHHS